MAIIKMILKKSDGSPCVRQYRQKDLPEILELMEDIYGKNTAQASAERWVWQYHYNPRLVACNSESPVYVLEVDNHVYSAIAGLAQKFWLQDRQFDGLWVTDFMSRSAVDTNLRNKGLGKALAAQFLSENSKKFDVIAGQLAPEINRYFTRLLQQGSLNLSAARLMVRPLNLSQLLKKYVRNGTLSRCLAIILDPFMQLLYPMRACKQKQLCFEKITTFNQPFNDFWNRVKHTGFKNLAVRDGEYLQWRYLNAPNRNYDCFMATENGTLKGWIVGRRTDHAGRIKARIIDALAPYDEPDIWHYLVDRILRFYLKQDVTIIQALGSYVPALDQAFQKTGFRPHPDKNRMPPFIGALYNADINQQAFYEDKNWYVTLGDSDIDLFG